jgi:hypothetical protein
MNFKKKVLAILALILVIGFFGCAKEQKAEAPKQEQIIKNLVPAKAQVTGPAFLVEVDNLQITTIVDTTSKEIVETPALKGSIKITNKSKDNLDIQAVTVDYFDGAGKPIRYGSDEKTVNVNPFWKVLKPEEVTEGNLDVTIPKKAVKEKILGRIEVNLVFVASPLKRENLSLPEKIE